MRVYKSWWLDSLLVATIVLAATVLRFYPGKDHFLWNTSDYARDVYVMREMVANQDLKLLGPRAEVFDQKQQAYLVHAGPLYYYVMAGGYFLSHGDPNLPLAINIFIHLTTMLPLGCLSWLMFKNKSAVLATLFLFAISYEQIEYSRWLLNPALAVPFLAWFFLCFYYLYIQRRHGLLTGIFLGLAMQNEIFLGYWLMTVLAVLILSKCPWQQWLKLGLGLVIGLLPLVISEIKFKFRATWSLINFVLTAKSGGLSWMEKGGRYLDHLGVVTHHNLWGFAEGWLVVLLIVLVVPIITYHWLDAKTKKIIPFLYLLFFSHALLFTFNFQNSIYVDVGLGLTIILLTVLDLVILWLTRWWWMSLFLMLTVAASQYQLLITNTSNNLPFGGQFFLQSDTLLYSQRMAVVEKIYELSGGQPFSIAILDTPYAWPATWASVFEQYGRRYRVPLPKWYGFMVEGVPGDRVFTKTDSPLLLHFALKPQNPVIDPYNQHLFTSQQDQFTKTKEIILLNNMIIERRVAKQKFI